MNVPSYEALLDKETRIKVIRELCENVNKALNSQMSVEEGSGTSVEAEVGKYYHYDDAVTSLTVTLPQPSDTSQLSNISFFLTTGSNPDIQFESDADIYFSGEDTFNDNTPYYITATYNGAAWIVTTTATVPPPAPHEYVEIAGIKWATMNVGANSVTDTGLYFQWGDTQGYTAEQCGSGEGQKYFGWADYKYATNAQQYSADMTKYNSTDGKTVLDVSDDAVTAAWGGSWRMPTAAEFQALDAAVNTEWVSDYQGSGVAGLVCTDKTDSSKTLFFPACGDCYNGNVGSMGNYGSYWSSLLFSSYIQSAYYLFFSSSNVNWQNSSNRYYGCAMRGVLDE